MRPVELFVSVLGTSSLTYAEATRTQQLPDWVDAHIRMAEYFGGSTIGSTTDECHQRLKQVRELIPNQG